MRVDVFNTYKKYNKLKKEYKNLKKEHNELLNCFLNVENRNSEKTLEVANLYKELTKYKLLYFEEREKRVKLFEKNTKLGG